jgi:hypothetical protein
MSVKEIVLVIKYRVDGARRLTRIKDLGVLVEVREDGIRREPKSTETNAVFRWLDKQGYEPVDHVWIDRAGGIYRRKKSTFRLNGKATITHTKEV